MKFTLIFILALCIIILIAGFYLLCRNNNVCSFRIAINHFMSDFLINYLNSMEDDDDFHKHQEEYERLIKCRDYIWEKYSYDQMLFSLKPLRIEDWFTKDELSFLKEYNQFVPNEQNLKYEIKLK